MVVLLPSTESEVWCGTPSKEQGASTSCFNLSSHWQTCSLATIYSHKRRSSAHVHTIVYWLWAMFRNERILRHKRFCENIHFIPWRVIHTHTQTFRYSQTHTFQCDLLWNQGGSRLISSWPALKTSLMPDLHVSLYNIWQRASGAIHQTSSSAFHPPHSECCAWSN